MTRTQRLVVSGWVMVVLQAQLLACGSGWYEPWLPIPQVHITTPADGSSIPVSTTVTAACTGGVDWDKYQPGNLPVIDPVTRTWSGAGSFSPGAGTSVSWTAPSTPGYYTLTVTADDSPLANESPTTDSITVTVVAVKDIQINAGSWQTVTGSTIKILLGSKYTFKALPDPTGAGWPTSTPMWSDAATGTGETIDVTFDTQGTHTLTAKCGANDPGKSVTITVLCPWLYRVGFGGDHALYATPAGYDGWADGTAAITDPVYDADVSKDEPACVTKNSNSVSLTDVRLKVSEALTYAQTITVDAGGTEEWNEAGGVSFSGTTSADASLAITGNIINEVKRYNGDFQAVWKYKVPSGSDWWMTLNTTNHKMYVTYGTPEPSGVARTVKRVEWVCNRADGESQITPCADDTYFGLAGSPPRFDLQGGNPTNVWWMMDPNGPSGQCIDLAYLMQNMCRLLGLGDGEIGLIYATTDDDCYSTSDNAFETRTPCPGGQHGNEYLRYFASGWNNWEAVFKINGWYYAVQVTKSQTPFGIINTIIGNNTPPGNHQAWRYHDGAAWQCCQDPGPHPVPLPD